MVKVLPVSKTQPFTQYLPVSRIYRVFLIGSFEESTLYQSLEVVNLADGR
jgi:hypothetical protein